MRVIARNAVRGRHAYLARNAAMAYGTPGVGRDGQLLDYKSSVRSVRHSADRPVPHNFKKTLRGELLNSSY